MLLNLPSVTEKGKNAANIPVFSTAAMAAAEPPASLPRDGGFGSPGHLTPQDSRHPVSNRSVHWTLGEGRSNICVGKGGGNSRMWHHL